MPLPKVSGMTDAWRELALDYVVEPPPEGFESWEEFARSAGIPEAEWGDQSSWIDPAGVGPRLARPSISGSAAQPECSHNVYNPAGQIPGTR